MNTPNNSRGFTLIELLVVLSIIGLLASIVFAALSTARNKGANAGVQQSMSGIHAQAEIQYNTLGCYAASGTTCSATVPAAASGACPSTGNTIFAETTIVRQITAAKSQGAGLNSCKSTAGGGAWAVATQLKTDPALAWCVDNTGARKVEGTAGGTALTQTTLDALIASTGRCQ